MGNYRVDRFVRWLASAGFHVVLVRSGSAAGREAAPWGTEITVRNPFTFSRNAVPGGVQVKTRRPKLLRTLAFRFLSPDPGILWARIAAQTPAVLEQAAGASLALSSSPPESSHIGAANLARKLGAKLIVDMRDGWLDDPLSPYLRNSKLRQWREGQLEKAILKQADKIFVTSPAWKELLVNRLPFAQDKTVTLTNGYPPESLLDSTKTRKLSPDEPIRLVHAGRFTGSMLTRHVSFLFQSLWGGISETAANGTVILLGELTPDDLAEVAAWRNRFSSQGWSIATKASVPRPEMMALLHQADGLLLLAEKQAAIPAKFYEYLVTGKPIFAATLAGSAVWQIGAQLPQLFLSDYTHPNKEATLSFLAACGNTENPYEIPPQFSEEALSRIFLRAIA